MDEKNFGGYAISIEMYYWILKNLPKGKIILELGSGTGTIELTNYYKVYSIEHEKKWLGYAKKSNYIYAPIINYKNYQWYDINRIKKLIPEWYDLLLIDGPQGHIGREGFLDNIKLFKMDIPIIVDDTNRKEDAKIRDIIFEKYNKKIINIRSSNKQFSILL